MKKIFYILAFGFLGLLVALLLHIVIELIALDLIFGNAENADMLLWQEWAMVHSVTSAVLWVVGLCTGLYAGVRLWNKYGSRPGAFGMSNKNNVV